MVIDVTATSPQGILNLFGSSLALPQSLLTVKGVSFMSRVNFQSPLPLGASVHVLIPVPYRKHPLLNHWYVCSSSFFNPCFTYHFICVYPLVSTCLLVTSDLKQFRLCMTNRWKFHIYR